MTFALLNYLEKLTALRREAVRSELFAEADVIYQKEKELHTTPQSKEAKKEEAEDRNDRP